MVKEGNVSVRTQTYSCKVIRGSDEKPRVKVTAVTAIFMVINVLITMTACT